MTDGRIFLPFAKLRNIKLHMVELDLPFAIWCLHDIANGRCIYHLPGYHLPVIVPSYHLPLSKNLISTMCHLASVYAPLHNWCHKKPTNGSVFVTFTKNNGYNERPFREEKCQIISLHIWHRTRLITKFVRTIANKMVNSSNGPATKLLTLSLSYLSKVRIYQTGH